MRAEVSKDKIELKKRAEEQSRLRKNRANNDMMTKVKLKLNILTLDNFERVKEEILSQCQEDMETVTMAIFLKAQKEAKYSRLYANLCQYLTFQELQTKGIDINKLKGKQITKRQKESTFRNKLLEECKTVFQEFFDENKDEDETEKKEEEPPAKELTQEERELEQTKYKKRLMGNIQFVGELFNMDLISRNVC